MFNITDISKSYGKKMILNNISLSVEPNQAVGILGTNGSGKSTFLTCIAKKYSNNPDFKIGYLPQDNPLFDELKPIDNIRMWTKYNKATILSKIKEGPIANMGITNYLDVPVANMSGGMKKRLSLATVLINEPDLLLLDEPFAALDLVAKQDMLRFMKSFINNGKSIIVASHDEGVFNFCNKVYLLNNAALSDTQELNNKGISYIDILRSNR